MWPEQQRTWHRPEKPLMTITRMRRKHRGTRECLRHWKKIYGEKKEQAQTLEQEITKIETQTEVEVQKRIEEAKAGNGGSSLTPQEEKKIRDQVEAEYAPKLEKARSDAEAAREAALEAEAAWNSYVQGDGLS